MGIVDPDLGPNHFPKPGPNLNLVGDSPMQVRFTGSDAGKLIEMYRDAIEKDTTNFSLWQTLCKVLVETSNLSDAIQECTSGIQKFGSVIAPVMVLSNLYAMKGSFEDAIATSARLIKEEDSAWIAALQSNNRSPVYNEVPSKSSLEEYFGSIGCVDKQCNEAI